MPTVCRLENPMWISYAIKKQMSATMQITNNIDCERIFESNKKKGEKENVSTTNKEKMV